MRLGLPQEVLADDLENFGPVALLNVAIVALVDYKLDQERLHIFFHDALHVLAVLRLPGKLAITCFDQIHQAIVLPHALLQLLHQLPLAGVGVRCFDCECVLLRNVRA